MQHEAAVPEEGALAFDERRVPVDVGGVEGGAVLPAGGGVDEAVFAAQVADLAGFGGGGVAGRRAPADVRVEVGEGLGAVAVVGHGGVVEVVGELAVVGGQVGEADAELYADAVGGCGGEDGALDVALDAEAFGEGFVGEDGFVDYAVGVTGDDLGVAEFLGGERKSVFHFIGRK